MTDPHPVRRRFARWTVAFAIPALTLSLLLPPVATLLSAALPPDAATALPEDGGRSDARSLFTPLDPSSLSEPTLPGRGADPFREDPEDGTAAPIGRPDSMPEDSEPTPEPTATPEPIPLPTASPDSPGFGALPPPGDRPADFDLYTSLPDGFVWSQADRYVTADPLNFRTGPGTSFPSTAKLKYAESVRQLGTVSGWSYVRTAAGKYGYVKSEYLAAKKPAPKLTAAQSLRLRVVALAKRQLGVTYTRYAASPTKGFDCSGLVWYVYGQVGITVPRSTGPYATFGTSVKLASILPGDILAWDARDDGVTSVTHVGIYVGNGLMIHASSSNDEVRYQDIYTYNERLLYVRRIIR